MRKSIKVFYEESKLREISIIMKAIVFGATKSAMAMYTEISKKYDIVAYCDNDQNKWGSEINDVKVIAPKLIPTVNYDEIIIASLSAMDVIRKQLLDMGIDECKINTSYVEFRVRAREFFVRDFAKLVYQRGLQGSVAEGGVFQGEFATIINECFSDRKLYLFDTFEGFDERDVILESLNGFSEAKPGYLNITSEELVLRKMKYVDKCVIKKGYFPETTEGIEDTFCFVNLDMDLYKPTIEGLRFFYPRMVKGGIIVVHDYFSVGYEGVNAAIEEFCREYPVIPFPIGDTVSIAFQKN